MYYGKGIDLLIALIIAGVTSISAWIIGVRMKRKIRKDLGREATDADLSSIETWMQVEEAEQKKESTKPLG